MRIRDVEGYRRVAELVAAAVETTEGQEPGWVQRAREDEGVRKEAVERLRSLVRRHRRETGERLSARRRWLEQALDEALARPYAEVVPLDVGDLIEEL